MLFLYALLFLFHALSFDVRIFFPLAAVASYCIYTVFLSNHATITLYDHTFYPVNNTFFYIQKCKCNFFLLTPLCSLGSVHVFVFFLCDCSCTKLRCLGCFRSLCSRPIAYIVCLSHHATKWPHILSCQQFIFLHQKMQISFFWAYSALLAWVCICCFFLCDFCAFSCPSFDAWIIFARCAHVASHVPFA